MHGPLETNVTDMYETKRKESTMNLWDCALGFMHAQMLLTAEELGLFDRLAEGPRTAADLAAATDLPSDSAERLLTGLCALGIVERQSDGRYANGSEAAEKLVSGKPGYIGDMFSHVREVLYPAWGDLKEALLENESDRHQPTFDGHAPPHGEQEEVPSKAVYDNPESLRTFMEGMHAITYEASAKFAAHAPELRDIRHIVDLGGASGAFLIALAQQFPDLRGTVFDLPPVQPIAEDFFRGQHLEDRLQFQAGDFFDDPLPSDADAYSLGFILHDWDHASGTYLLKKIAEVLPQGGLLIIGESLLDEDRTGPLHVARNNLNMMVAARGRERTVSEYRDWIAACGFELERVESTEEKDFLIARRT